MKKLLAITLLMGFLVVVGCKPAASTPTAPKTTPTETPKPTPPKTPTPPK